jgi:hypothetical protein
MSSQHTLDVPYTPNDLHKTLYTACRIAQLFPDSPPTVDSLRLAFGMSRATAYRWIAAWTAASHD